MLNLLTYWGRATHICVCKLAIIGSDNGLSPGRRQAIIWTNAGILLIGPLGTNFSEISIKIRIFSFMKMHLKMSSVKWRPLCLGLNVLMKHHCCLLLINNIHYREKRLLGARFFVHNACCISMIRYFSQTFPELIVWWLTVLSFSWKVSFFCENWLNREYCENSLWSKWTFSYSGTLSNWDKWCWYFFHVVDWC